MKNTSATSLSRFLSRAVSGVYVAYVVTPRGAKTFVKNDGTNGPLSWTSDIHKAELYFDAMVIRKRAAANNWKVENLSTELN